MSYQKGMKEFRKDSFDVFLLITVMLVFTAGFITAVIQSPLSSGQTNPDLSLTSNDIIFSNDQPMEYETICFV